MILERLKIRRQQPTKGGVMKFDCDQCGNKFESEYQEDPEDFVPETCPKCGRIVNFIDED